ncbi:CotH kinase family protein [Owenweeksia hongkongensis]|uniref:CotH kinase family protein n=1 Tax=Owenweeksia hongkongensis TaxID=253245 RepID=UPI003A8E02F8
MKKYLIGLLAILALAACSELDVENKNLPDVNGITPTTISTKFSVANIECDQAEFDKMYRLYSRDLSVDARLFFYNQNGDLRLNATPAQIEVKGNGSASLVLKSIGIRFNQPLNNDSAQIFQPTRLINNHSVSTFHALRFRNSGQDFGRTMIKDIAYTELAIQAGLDFEMMYYEPVHVFINDEYYGLMNMRTENEAFGIAGLINMPVSGITTMDSQMKDGEFEWESGPEEPSNELLEAIENKDWQEIEELVDMSSYIDYLIYEDYIGNRDWPNNNLRLYSSNGSPFRFMLYDSDYAADRPKDPELPKMEYDESGMASIYQSMKDAPDYRERFIARQKELYSFFSSEKFNTIVDRLATDIEDDIPYLISKYQKPESRMHWRQHIEILKREFERQDKYIRKKHKLN